MPIDLKVIWEFLKRPTTVLTLTYCAAFLCLGLLLAGLGPSLPTLGRNTNSPDTRMGATVTSRALGYLTGSTSGPIFHRLPGNKMVAASLIFTACVCFLVPHLTSFYVLCSLFFFQGLSMGMLDTGCNLMTLWLHRANADPYIQSLHAAFAVGAVISPAVIKAFLSSGRAINVAWYIIGIAFLPCVALLMYFPSPSEPAEEGNHSSDADDAATTTQKIADDSVSVQLDEIGIESSDSKEGGAVASSNEVSPPPRPSTPSTSEPVFAFTWENRYNTDYKPYLMVLGVAAFLLCYVGGEVATGSFMTTFALRRGLTSEDGGAFLTFLFWFTFAFGRLIAIPLSLYMTPKMMLLIDLVGTSISVLFVWAMCTRYVGFAIALISYGFFMASTFPSAITLLQTVIPITGNMTTVFIIGASAGEMLVPLLVSANFEATNYMSLIYVQFASVTAGSVCMIAVGIVARLILNQREVKRKLEEKVAQLHAASPHTANGHSDDSQRNGHNVDVADHNNQEESMEHGDKDGVKLEF